MVKKELVMELDPNYLPSSRFIRFFQEKTLLLLKNKGFLTEKQHRIGLKLLEENPR